MALLQLECTLVEGDLCQETIPPKLPSLERVPPGSTHAATCKLVPGNQGSVSTDSTQDLWGCWGA